MEATFAILCLLAIIIAGATGDSQPLRGRRCRLIKGA